VEGERFTGRGEARPDHFMPLPPLLILVGEWKQRPVREAQPSRGGQLRESEMRPRHGPSWEKPKNRRSSDRGKMEHLSALHRHSLRQPPVLLASTVVEGRPQLIAGAETHAVPRARVGDNCRNIPTPRCLSPCPLSTNGECLENALAKTDSLVPPPTANRMFQKQRGKF
jgi:hypothetical protein